MGRFTCKGCTERHLGCHATCEKYLKEKAQNDKEREQERLRRTSTFYKPNTDGTLYAGKRSKRRDINE